MKSDLESIVGELPAQHAELASLLAPLDEAGWARPTPCEGWTVADVVLHLAQTDELAIASAADRFLEAGAELLGTPLSSTITVDAMVDKMVTRERGADSIYERWLTGTETLRKALLDSDEHGRLQWVTGWLSTRTLTTTRIAECWIHTTDVATALGTSVPPSDRLWHIARLAWRTIPYAFARANRELSGPVAFELTAPDNSPWDFGTKLGPLTVVRGTAADLCTLAGRRATPGEVPVTATGPDAAAVLELVRTYA